MITFSQIVFFNACYVSVFVTFWNKIYFLKYFLNYLEKLQNMKMPGLFEKKNWEKSSSGKRLLAAFTKLLESAPVWVK